MRARKTHINIRTTPKEKAQFTCNAHKCGLSLSEYLRKLAGGYKPREAPPIQYAELIRLLSGIHNDFKNSLDVQCAQLIAQVVLDLQAQISIILKALTDYDRKLKRQQARNARWGRSARRQRRGRGTYLIEKAAFQRK